MGFGYYETEIKINYSIHEAFDWGKNKQKVDDFKSRLMINN
jgi:hypothetical protein